MAKAYIDFIRKNDGFCILLADNHECAVPRKAWMMFEQNMTPQEQLDYSVKMFEPIKRNIVGAVTGNHAWRAYHDAGIEMDKEMMSRLGILHHYYGFQGFVEIPYGNQTYRVVFCHGNNAGKNVFANCEKMNAAYPNGDIYASSHTHILAATTKQTWQYKQGKLQLKQYYYVSTGSLLNYPLYAGQALYQPQVKGFAIAWIYPDRYFVDIDVSGQIKGYEKGNSADFRNTEIHKEPLVCKKCGGTDFVKNGQTVVRGMIKQRQYCRGCNIERHKKNYESEIKSRSNFLKNTNEIIGDNNENC